MASEKDLQIVPIAQDAVVHNTKTFYNLQSLTASVFGVGAGILGLESYAGFLFYAGFTLVTALLFYALRVAPTTPTAAPSAKRRPLSLFDTSRYYRGAFEFWTGGLFNGLAGFILTWTLFYGLVRA